MGDQRRRIYCKGRQHHKQRAKRLPNVRLGAFVPETVTQSRAAKNHRRATLLDGTGSINQRVDVPDRKKTGFPQHRTLRDRASRHSVSASLCSHDRKPFGFTKSMFFLKKKERQRKEKGKRDRSKENPVDTNDLKCLPNPTGMF